MFVELLKSLRPIRGLPVYARYGLTTLIVLFALALRFLASNYIPPYPYLTFIPAILVESFLFDRGSGFLATFESAFLALYFFIKPANSIEIRDAATVVGLLTFLLVGLLLATLIEALRVTVDQLSEEREKLATAHRQIAAADEQKALLLRDINHRTKNNLQAVMGALELQMRRIQDPVAREALDTTVGRLAVMARVYDRLYLHQDVTAVNGAEFVTGLCEDLNASLVGSRPLVVRADAEDGELDLSRAVFLGTIVNELVTNALKHAFPDDRPGEVIVRMRREGETVVLTVEDDGIGITDQQDRPGTGMRLVRSLVQQLDGTIVTESVHGRTRHLIRVPKQPAYYGA
jgi:two-component sensor histidine kinase